MGCLWCHILTLWIFLKIILIFLGTREERAVSSLLKMGPAIVNGGITTFLALLLLGFSQSHVFITFFKVLIELVICFFQSLKKNIRYAFAVRNVHVVLLNFLAENCPSISNFFGQPKKLTCLRDWTNFFVHSRDFFVQFRYWRVTNF